MPGMPMPTPGDVTAGLPQSLTSARPGRGRADFGIDVAADHGEHGVSARPAGPRPRPVAAVAAAALLVVAVFAGATAVIQWRRADNLSRDQSVRSAATRAAGDFAAALHTYSYTGLNAWEQKIVSMATPTFGQAFAAAERNLSGSLVSARASERATAGTVYLGPLTGSRAEAVVTLTGQLQASGQDHATRYVLELVLVRQSGRWEVSGARTVPDNASGTAAG
jgi:hypothetical protein